jgi:hypothetical protein
VTFNVLDDFDRWLNMLQSMVFFREYYLKVKRVQLVFGDCVLLALQLTTPTFVTHCSLKPVKIASVLFEN